MTDITIAQKAEQLSANRVRQFFILAVIYLGQQFSFFVSLDGQRTVDMVKVGAWAVPSTALLVALMTGGAFLRSREMRDLLNDEMTRAHRADALSWGFVVAMLNGIGLYVLASFTTVGLREAIHLIVSMGIATALVRFAKLEKRAMGDD